MCTTRSYSYDHVASYSNVVDHRRLHIVNWNVSGLHCVRVVVLLPRSPQGFSDAITLHRERLPAQV